MMPKITSIEKFRGANDKNIAQWLFMFEAQCRALEISEEHNKSISNYSYSYYII